MSSFFLRLPWLVPEVTREIEAEVLRPYQGRLENLEQYQQVFSEAVQHEYPLSSHARSELEDLREVLGLRQKDVDSIEQEVVDRIIQKPKLEKETYEKTLHGEIKSQRYIPPEFDGRIGKLEFVNTGLYPVKVNLWHSDNSSLWRTYTIQGGEHFVLNDDANQPVNFGSSWGIQLGDSEIKPIANVAEWKKGNNGQHYFRVTIDDFWK